MQVESKPRVLWFTNTPSMAARHLQVTTIGGGWITSLEEKVKESNKAHLAVAFEHGQKEVKKFYFEGTTYYAIPNRTTKLQGLLDRHLNRMDNDPLISDCLEIIRDYQPDLINVFGTESGFGLIAGKIQIPVMIHIQGILTVYQLKWFAAGVSKLALLLHSGIKTLLKGESLLHQYFYIRKAADRERQIFRHGKYFLGRTDWDRRVTSVLSDNAHYFESNEMLRKEFYPLFWDKKPVAIKTFISTIQSNIYKGLETILESAVLLKTRDEFEFTWYVAGISEDDDLIKIFERKIAKKFKKFNIVLIGKMVAEQLVHLELEADIFIHPSHIDNSPNSICEAMLLGMPVIATNSGGTGSLLIDKKEGILIQDGDPYSMAGAIIELIRNPDYAAKLGGNARERALKRHHPSGIVDNLLSIYFSILNQYSSKWA